MHRPVFPVLQEEEHTRVVGTQAPKTGPSSPKQVRPSDL
uniref:Uncharacterized protein n=1 Tax=Anguilla anguilla TaxID=7936 RepID=A0A0E9UJX5_ANGAN